MTVQYREKQRQRPRTVSLNTVRFHLGHDSDGEVHLGTTVNISPAGMCLYTLNRLREGQSIMIRNDDVLMLSRRATVQWVKRYGNTFCKAGLMFIE